MIFCTHGTVKIPFLLVFFLVLNCMFTMLFIQKPTLLLYSFSILIVIAIAIMNVLDIVRF